MTAFRLSSLAERDLEKIVGTISQQSGSDRAETVLRAILAATGRLADTPGMGHTRADLTEEDVLFWTVRGYFIVLPAGIEAARSGARAERMAQRCGHAPWSGAQGAGSCMVRLLKEQPQPLVKHPPAQTSATPMLCTRRITASRVLSEPSGWPIYQNMVFWSETT